MLRPLLTRFYSRREHIEDLHDIYVDACLLSGLKARKDGDDRKALEYMLMMNEYPENHGYAHLEYYARDAQVYYNIGLAYERVGDRRNAGNISKWRRQVEVPGRGRHLQLRESARNEENRPQSPGRRPCSARSSRPERPA